MTFDEAYELATIAIKAAKANKVATEVRGVTITARGGLRDAQYGHKLTLGEAIGVAAYNIRHTK